MKTAIIAIAMVLFTTHSYAGEVKIVDLPKDMKLSSCGDECLEIKTRNDLVFRVYSCGKVQKLDWKTINGNEDQILYFDSGTISEINTWLPTTEAAEVELNGE